MLTLVLEDNLNSTEVKVGQFGEYWYFCSVLIEFRNRYQLLRRIAKLTPTWFCSQTAASALARKVLFRRSTYPMASSPINRQVAYVDRPDVDDAPLPIERRRRARAQVHWPVVFAGPREDGLEEVIRSVTHDLSSNGFYCIANVTFVPGETRECTLVVPTHNPFGGPPVMPVTCRVRVIRVEAVGEAGLYGVGFRIEDYRFGPASESGKNRTAKKLSIADAI
jgi:hypothetical protein